MKIRICSTDSGTGEEWILDGEVESVTPLLVAGAMAEALAAEAGCAAADIPVVVCEAWVARSDGRLFAFVFRSVEPYFGEVLSIGHVYLNFV